MPRTFVTEDPRRALEAVRLFERAVLKPLYSSKARGMQVVSAGPHAEDQIRAFQIAGNPMIYVQQMVPFPGHDLGVVFLGGRYLATYARVGRFLTPGATEHAMSRYEAFEPSAEIVTLAERAQGLFGLDFTCVDVVETDEGPLVFEVSTFGGFRGLLEGNKIDAATLLADYVLDRAGVWSRS
jgi:ribosomal protein S6--L-glutamate ligase